MILNSVSRILITSAQSASTYLLHRLLPIASSSSVVGRDLLRCVELSQRNSLSGVWKQNKPSNHSVTEWNTTDVRQLYWKSWINKNQNYVVYLISYISIFFIHRFFQIFLKNIKIFWIYFPYLFSLYVILLCLQLLKVLEYFSLIKY